MGFRKDRASSILLDSVEETLKEILPQEENTLPDNPEPIKEVIIENPVQPVNTIEEKPVVVKITKPRKKKIRRESKKVNIDCGLKGTTVECKDFRAIVKKKGGQINTVLNGLLAVWNHENYNL